MSSLAFKIRRRTWMQWALGTVAVPVSPSFSQSTGSVPPSRIPIADMHTHLGLTGLFGLKQQPSTGDLATEMRSHSATLVSWKLVADFPWLGFGLRGIYQRSEPNATELWEYFDSSAKTMLAYIKQQGLDMVRTPADVDAALAGKPSVVLASEAAEFLAGDLSVLSKAFDLGLRHLQLVHYIRTPVGDFSTESPVHNGLTTMGRDLIKACEKLGVLVDIAHCSNQAIDHALEVATKPMIWSHGWVDGDGGSHRDPYGFLKRRLSVDHAKKIAGRGGVVGLWGLGLNRPGLGWSVGVRDRAGYAFELAKLVNLIGADHVGLGTDIGGVGDYWSVNSYSHVREVVQALEAHKMNASTIEKVAYGNFVRVLKATLPSA